MDFSYDVAISFLGRDEPLALQVRDALAPLRVFVYSEEQKKLAGRDGLEAFRETFRRAARVALVLFRDGWGKTPWTRVEETAIKDLCLYDEGGWDALMFVQLDKSPKPTWIPGGNLYLDFDRFGLGDLVGAVKAKCARLGVDLRALTPAERARRIAEEERFAEETRSLIQRDPTPLYDAARELFVTIEQHLADIERKTGWTVIRGARDGRELVAGFQDGNSIRLLAKWDHSGAEAALVLGIFHGRVLTPEEQARPYVRFEAPTERHSERLRLTRAPELGWCWEYDGRKRSVAETADHVAEALISAREDESSAFEGLRPRFPRRW